MPELDKSTIEELSRFFAPAYVREEVERLRGWQQQLALDTSFGRVIQSPTWISGVSIQNNTVDAQKLNVGELRAITAYTGELVVAGAGKTAAGGQLTIAANPDTPGLSSIVMRATASGPYQAGIELRNASGTVTTRLKLDGSGQLGSGATAITWDTSGVVSIPAGAIAGGLVITDIGGGRIGGIYEMYVTSPNPVPKIIMDPQLGIGSFGAGVTPLGDWSNAKYHLRPDGSAKFTGGIEIVHQATNAKLTISTSTGIRLENTSTSTTVFELNSSGVLRIRKARIGDDGATGYVEIGSSGISAFSNASQSTFALNTDGSGYIKAGTSGTNGIQWNASSLTINASAINVQNLTVDKVTGGIIGGTYDVGGGNRIVWARAGTSNVPTSYVESGKLRIESFTDQARFISASRDLAGNVIFFSGLQLFCITSTSSTGLANLQYIYGTSESSPSSGPNLVLGRDGVSDYTQLTAGGTYFLIRPGSARCSGATYFDSLIDVTGAATFKGNVSVEWLNYQGQSKFTLKNSQNETVFAVASDGSTYYRGPTTTAAPGAYAAAMLWTVKIGGVDTTYKIPLYT